MLDLNGQTIAILFPLDSWWQVSYFSTLRLATSFAHIYNPTPLALLVHMAADHVCWWATWFWASTLSAVSFFIVHRSLLYRNSLLTRPFIIWIFRFTLRFLQNEFVVAGQIQQFGPIWLNSSFTVMCPCLPCSYTTHCPFWHWSSQISLK